MIAAMLCCAISGFAEKKAIELEKEKRPHERSEVLLPTASIDGSILSINFIEDTDAWVYVLSSIGEIAYSTSQTTQQTIIDLQSLGDGVYRLKIVQGNEIYEGDFSIEE